MKLASFNVESLFARPAALNEESWAEGRPYLESYARISALLGAQHYTEPVKKKIIAELRNLGLEHSDAGGKYALLRQNRGHLVSRPAHAPIEIVATGRGDWIGWVELKLEAVNEVATRNTAKVIDEMRADVLGVVEAEDRIALNRFNDDVLKAAIHGRGYEHIMLIDGNDDRGIDVGLLTHADHEIVGIVSHVDDTDEHGIIFSRDCAEYEIVTPAQHRFLLMINHLKSKGYGAQADSNAKRLRQAQRTREIYDQRRSEGIADIAIIGDFNDTPTSAPLAPLLAQGSELKDASTHPSFQSDGRPGTFGNGTAAEKFDYILLSPPLYNKVNGGAVFRKGVWGGTHGTLWPIFDTITGPTEAASDHAAIWVELDI